MDEKGPAQSATSITIPLNYQGRLPGLEELRSLAAILVVGLHSGVPYLRTRMTALSWPTHDAHPSALVDALYWCIEGFIMPLFFVLSGWSAATLCLKKNHLEFVADRTRRVLVPLFVASLLILPMMLFIWSAGWVIYLGYPPNKLLSFNFDGEMRGNLWGLAHLWYLEYLYVYCLALALVAGLGSWIRRRPTLAGRLPIMLFPAGMFVLAAIVLSWDRRVVLGFYQTYLPVPSKLAYYAIYFSAGIALKHLPALQSAVQRWSGTCSLIAAAAFGVLLPLIHGQDNPAFSLTDRVCLGVALAAFGVSTTLSIFGFFLGRSRPAQPWVLGLSEASLWIYVMHLPAVGLAQIDLAAWGGPTVVKFALVWTTAVVWTLLTYEGLVRNTWLGHLLHGERQLAQRGFSMTILRAMLVTSRSKAA
jgi:peptidoglycan/LPS O-acetylase OafA/YrhL